MRFAFFKLQLGAGSSKLLSANRKSISTFWERVAVTFSARVGRTICNRRSYYAFRLMEHFERLSSSVPRARPCVLRTSSYESPGAGSLVILWISHSSEKLKVANEHAKATAAFANRLGDRDALVCISGVQMPAPRLRWRGLRAWGMGSVLQLFLKRVATYCFSK